MTFDEMAPRLDSAEALVERIAQDPVVSQHIIEGGFAWPANNLEVSFRACRFEDCILAGADLAGAVFDDCEFLQCSLRGSDLRDARFTNCKLYLNEQSSDLRYAELRDAVFEDCDLTTCTFERANAYGLSLIRCQAQGADFTNVDFSMTLGRNQTVAGFTCSDSNLAYADFSSTYLSGVTFNGVRLAHAVLNNCDLSHATIVDCELDNIESQRLTLAGANLSGSQFNSLNPKTIDLTGTKVDADQALSLLTAMGIEIL